MSWTTRAAVVLWVVAIAYALSFAFAVRSVNLLWIMPSYAGSRPSVGYYYSDNPTVDACCYRVFWPLGKSLELTGYWVGVSGPAIHRPPSEDQEAERAGPGLSRETKECQE